MSAERELSRHERELSTRLYRPSRTLAGTDVSTLGYVNALAEELKNEKGFVAVSLRGSHMLGYESAGTIDDTGAEVWGSDIDVNVFYDSSARGFKGGGILSSYPKQIERFLPRSKDLKVTISITPIDVAPILQLQSLPRPGEQGRFIDFAAGLCEWLVYDFDAAGKAGDKQAPRLKKILSHMQALINSSGPAIAAVFMDKITDRLIRWERNRAFTMQERLSTGTEQFDYENIAGERRRIWHRHVRELFG